MSAPHFGHLLTVADDAILTNRKKIGIPMNNAKIKSTISYIIASLNRVMCPNNLHKKN